MDRAQSDRPLNGARARSDTLDRHDCAQRWTASPSQPRERDLGTEPGGFTPGEHWARGRSSIAVIGDPKLALRISSSLFKHDEPWTSVALRGGHRSSRSDRHLGYARLPASRACIELAER